MYLHRIFVSTALQMSFFSTSLQMRFTFADLVKLHWKVGFKWVIFLPVSNALHFRRWGSQYVQSSRHIRLSPLSNSTTASIASRQSRSRLTKMEKQFRNGCVCVCYWLNGWVMYEYERQWWSSPQQNERKRVRDKNSKKKKSKDLIGFNPLIHRITRSNLLPKE